MALRFRGADLSFLPQEEAAGAIFRDAGTPAPVERILARHGATHARLRLWVDPAGGTNGLQPMLAMGRRAHQAGMGLYASLHYSDTWADPRHQALPAAWKGQNLAELAQSVETYTRDVVNAFAAQGTPLALVQIGNEVDSGLLWPRGWISPTTDAGWASFFSLVRAGLRGATSATSGAAPQTALHLSAGTDNALCRNFFDRAFAADVRPDVIALSYYPFWNGSLSALAANLHDLVGRYASDVLIAETAYPWTLANADRLVNVVTRTDQLPDVATCPPTPAGQQAYYQQLQTVLQGVTGGRAAGFVVWAPDWLGRVGVTASEGNAHDNLTLFDHNGDGLPALACFAP